MESGQLGGAGVLSGRPRSGAGGGEGIGGGGGTDHDEGARGKVEPGQLGGAGVLPGRPRGGGVESHRLVDGLRHVLEARDVSDPDMSLPSDDVFHFRQQPADTTATSPPRDRLLLKQSGPQTLAHGPNLARGAFSSGRVDKKKLAKIS